MAITLNELAKQLGLSNATVSMALRNSPRIAADTRERVRKLAGELNYVPNNFGRGLQSRRSRLLGYMLGTVTRSFLNELLDTVGFASMYDGYGLLTGWVPDTPEAFRSQLQLMLEKNVDALIFTLTGELVYPHIPLLRAHRKPFIFCSCYCPPEYDSVVGDHYLGGRMALEHLAEAGHRAVLVSECRSLEERLRGYSDAAREREVTLHCYRSSGEIPAMLDAMPEVTAIAAFSDAEALEIRHLLQDSGRSVPGDVSLIGYDGAWFTQEREFSLTTVAQPVQEIGRSTYRRLTEILAGDSDPRQILLAPSLRPGASVAPPKTGK